MLHSKIQTNTFVQWQKRWWHVPSFFEFYRCVGLHAMSAFGKRSARTSKLSPSLYIVLCPKGQRLRETTNLVMQELQTWHVANKGNFRVGCSVDFDTSMASASRAPLREKLGLILGLSPLRVTWGTRPCDLGIRPGLEWHDPGHWDVNHQRNDGETPWHDVPRVHHVWGEKQYVLHPGGQELFLDLIFVGAVCLRFVLSCCLHVASIYSWRDFHALSRAFAVAAKGLPSGTSPQVVILRMRSR